MNGKLIEAQDSKMEADTMDNIFITSAKKSEVVTLSLYNRADKYEQDTLPPKQKWVDNDFLIEEEQEPPKFPPFKEPTVAPKRDGLSSIRLAQQQEIENIKRRLAKDDISCDASILHQAIIIPEEQDRNLIDHKYPKIECSLMVNPFPKEKKKKKKKKGRR